MDGLHHVPLCCEPLRNVDLPDELVLVSEAVLRKEVGLDPLPDHPEPPLLFALNPGSPHVSSLLLVGHVELVQFILGHLLPGIPSLQVPVLLEEVVHIPKDFLGFLQGLARDVPNAAPLPSPPPLPRAWLPILIPLDDKVVQAILVVVNVVLVVNIVMAPSAAQIILVFIQVVVAPKEVLLQLLLGCSVIVFLKLINSTALAGDPAHVLRPLNPDTSVVLKQVVVIFVQGKTFALLFAFLLLFLFCLLLLHVVLLVILHLIFVHKEIILLILVLPFVLLF
mmetsp:Transcript_12878/g.30544  ORF Transcript_12878/g.30544 Transcript_12878/m.30544 type:complete len:280 (+) Transcript_12878:2294-3133(+)